MREQSGFELDARAGGCWRPRPAAAGGAGPPVRCVPRMAGSSLVITFGSSRRVAAMHLGLDEIEPGLRQAAHVRDGVVVVLQRGAQLAQLVERHQRGVEIGHWNPPLTGGSTATSSDAPTAAVRSTVSPLTHTRHVPSTVAKPAPYRSTARSSTSPERGPVDDVTARARGLTGRCEQTEHCHAPERTRGSPVSASTATVPGRERHSAGTLARRELDARRWRHPPARRPPRPERVERRRPLAGPRRRRRSTRPDGCRRPRPRWRSAPSTASGRATCSAPT